MLLITHDPHLVELVADRLWLVGDGSVKPFDGDLDDYRALLVERARPAAKAGAVTRKDDRRERAETRAALAPIRRKAQEAEKRLAALVAERARIETKLADPACTRPAGRPRSPPPMPALVRSPRRLPPPRKPGWWPRKNWRPLRSSIRRLIDTGRSAFGCPIPGVAAMVPGYDRVFLGIGRLHRQYRDDRGPFGHYSGQSSCVPAAGTSGVWRSSWYISILL